MPELVFPLPPPPPLPHDSTRFLAGTEFNINNDINNNSLKQPWKPYTVSDNIMLSASYY